MKINGLKKLTTDVLIIGGGTAGCYAALTIAEKSDYSVVIAEKANKKSYTATIISIISLSVAIFTNLDKITTNVHWLLTYLLQILH